MNFTFGLLRFPGSRDQLRLPAEVMTFMPPGARAHRTDQVKTAESMRKYRCWPFHPDLPFDLDVFGGASWNLQRKRRSQAGPPGPASCIPRQTAQKPLEPAAERAGRFVHRQFPVPGRGRSRPPVIDVISQASGGRRHEETGAAGPPSTSAVGTAPVGVGGRA